MLGCLSQVPPGVTETVEQKYTRLQHELRELAEEVSKKESSSIGTEQPPPVILAKQVEYLQGQLTELKLDTVLGHPSSGTSTTSPSSLAHPQAALQKYVLQ